MESTKNMTVNPLPALTWNRLKMNAGEVELLSAQTGAEITLSGLPEGVSVRKFPEISGKSEKIGISGLEISGNQNFQEEISGKSVGICGKSQEIRGKFQETESGMGAEFEQYMADSAVTLVEVQSGCQTGVPVMISLDYTEGTSAADRIYIHAAEGSSIPVIFILKSTQKVQACLQVKTIAEAEANVQLYVVQLTGEGSTVLTDVASLCKEKAQVSLTKLELGGGAQYVGVCTTLKGDKSAFHAEAGYRVRAGQHLDMNYLVRHVGRKTTSEMNASGVLEENAFKLFRGTIDFPRGCAGAKGNEKEDILLLGERQVNQTIPLILCQEEDVEGNHGATIGRLPEQVLFYLGTRGISAQAAEDLIASAKLEAVCSLIPDEKVQQTVRAFLCAMTRDRICG